MTSLSRALTIRLTLLGTVLFVAFIAAVLAFTFITEDPGVLRNDVTSQIIRQSVRPSGSAALQVEKSPGLLKVEQASPLLWYLVSDGRSVVEYAPELRPGLPIDIRLDGPTIAAQMRVGGDNALSVDVAEQHGSRILVATGGGRPGWDVILGYFLRAIAGSAAAISVVFGIMIAAAIAMSVSYITSRLRSAAEAAARIDPRAPRGLLGRGSGEPLVPRAAQRLFRPALGGATITTPSYGRTGGVVSPVNSLAVPNPEMVARCPDSAARLVSAAGLPCRPGPV